MIEVFTWVTAIACVLAALFVWAGIGIPGARARRAGRGLIAVGFALLGSRLLYLLIMGDLVRLHPLSLIAITFVALGTAAIWADIVDSAEEGHQ
jgi:Zn-dependent protease